MYIIRVNDGVDCVLTYTFQNNSWGKAGDDILGVCAFLEAFKKYFADWGHPASAVIMNDQGLYYSNITRTYTHANPADYKEFCIPLNKMAEEQLK